MDKQQRKESIVSLQTLKRLPNYYNYVRSLQEDNVDFVAAPAIAKEMGLNEVQVRKDLAAVSPTPGKPRKGFVVEELLQSIGECLGYHNNEDAVLVGAGSLGKALLSFQGFAEHGVRIVAAFDTDEDLVGTTVGKKKIFPMEKLPSMCKRMHVHIGIITVPANQAQAVCDVLVENGVQAIWNFAPIHLYVPENVLVQNENMAERLAILARRPGEKVQE